MTTRTFGMGFFGRNPFSQENRKELKEKWSKMTDAEKLEFMNKRMEFFDKHEDPFSIEAIDFRCEEWLKKTPEEKQAFITERKKDFQAKREGMRGFFR